MTPKRTFALLFPIALFAMGVRATIDPDMWWHLRTGEAILTSGIPQQDIFSFTVPNNAWITHEWLSQLLMWLVYRTAGLGGLIVVFAAITAVTYWLVYRCSEGQPYLATFVTLLAAIASAIVWGARPQMFNLLLTALFVYVVERYKQAHISQRSLWWLPLATLVWANLHSGYLLGVVLLGTYSVGEGLQRVWHPKTAVLTWSQIFTLAGVTAVSFLAAVVNPNGAELWIYPFFTLGSSAMQAYIQEWHSPDFHLIYFWPFAILAGVGILAWIVGRQRPTWSEGLLFFGTLAAGLISARNIPIFAIVVVPIVCRHLVRASMGTAVYPLVSGERDENRGMNRFLSGVNVVVVGLVLLSTLIWTANTLMENEAVIEARYPVTAVDYLYSSGLAETRGYNSYNWGGYLIWRGVPVFVDGRADVYGDDFLFYYRRTFDVRSNWQAPLDRYNVDYVIMERGSGLAVVLSMSETWQEAYQDDIAQIFVRSAP